MSDTQRTARISIRLSPAERDRIIKAAAAAKRAPSDYLRVAGLEDADRTLAAPPAKKARAA